MAGGDLAPGGLVLRGRRDECSVLDGLLDGARSGRSGVLVLRGEAGVGKTAIVGYAIESAADLAVLEAAGCQAEMSWRSRCCISSARRCSIALKDFQRPSAARWKSRSG